MLESVGTTAYANGKMLAARDGGADGLALYRRTTAQRPAAND